MTPETPEIRIAIVDDDSEYCSTIADLLSTSPTRFQLVGTYGNAESALEELPSLAPDVILMDIKLPGMSGVECARRLSERLPKTQIIMLTALEDFEKIFQSICAGALGYLVKASVKSELLDLILDVRSGGSPLSTGIARQLISAFRKMAPPAAVVYALTPREEEILEGFRRGKTPKEISQDLKISTATVRKHTQSIFRKLQVHTRRQAVQKAEFLERMPSQSGLGKFGQGNLSS